MTKITVDHITTLANLARIGLESDEIAGLAIQITSILTFVEALDAVSTQHIIPTSQVTGLTDVWRDDVVIPCQLTREQLLQVAPDTVDGYVKVKRVLA